MQCLDTLDTYKRLPAGCREGMMYVTPAMLFGCGTRIHLHDTKQVSERDGVRWKKNIKKIHVHKRLHIIGVRCLILLRRSRFKTWVVYTDSLFSGYLHVGACVMCWMSVVEALYATTQTVSPRMITDFEPY